MPGPERHRTRQHRHRAGHQPTDRHPGQKRLVPLQRPSQRQDAVSSPHHGTHRPSQRQMFIKIYDGQYRIPELYPQHHTQKLANKRQRPIPKKNHNNHQRHYRVLKPLNESQNRLNIEVEQRRLPHPLRCAVTSSIRNHRRVGRTISRLRRLRQRIKEYRHQHTGQHEIRSRRTGPKSNTRKRVVDNICRIRGRTSSTSQNDGYLPQKLRNKVVDGKILQLRKRRPAIRLRCITASVNLSAIHHRV